MTKLSYRQIPAAVAERSPFEGNSMKAERVPPTGYVRFGFLPQDEARILDAARAEASDALQTLYVVYSYATPIAWGTDDGPLYVPDVKYSVTTSRQQHLVRVANHGERTSA